MSSTPELSRLIVSCPRGLADLLAAELESFGAVEVRERSSGVACAGSLEVAYRACIGSRLANRVLLEISSFEAADATQFYGEAHALDWMRHIGPGATLACDFSGRHPAITHTHFGALKLKDAVCDRLRETTGARPDIQPERPSVRVHAHATDTRIVLSIDLSGESLHRRGYRVGGGEAPLKENVAAGMLQRAGWRELAARGGEFLDPLCGSGTLVIEAAMIAAEIAPRLPRDHFGFLGWRGHDAALWARVRHEAEARARLGREQARGLILRGSDRDDRAIETARRNSERAGVADLVQFETKALSEASPQRASPADGAPADRVAAGLLATNPPYGVRLEDREAARAVHRELGAVLRERFAGWDAAVLTGAPELGRELGIRAHRTHTLWNGAIECRLLRMKVAPESLREPGRLARPGATVAAGPGARMFANRLAKNLKRLGAWADRSGVSCYRLYDADMPEYAFAIDRYEEEGAGATWLYVQEYAAPAEIELEAVRRRRGEVLATLPEATGVAPERIRVRVRRRTRRGEQYVRREERGRSHIVAEGGLKFEVNFDEYLDTGLFLDHRLIRARLREGARGARFLNLFAYTGTATVYAASGGAQSTTSVDLSRTYLEWAQRNLALNGLAEAEHALVQADCREWLAECDPARERFDLIFLDPPTFSNSKRMEGVLDIARDHPALLAACARLLAPGGLILFSTNAQRFRLAEALGALYEIRDISAATIPLDFERNPRIHRAYEVRPSGEANRE
ncbi:MAG TPA: bifunctional 23S rRNA (guanine(2069)-N(7))-methyltransferase RlmK/23S rRNA (guanine(2445)-N(2))-methyltransferase RlmL [Steroidobacteraceae bacterium]